MIRLLSGFEMDELPIVVEELNSKICNNNGEAIAFEDFEILAQNENNKERKRKYIVSKLADFIQQQNRGNLSDVLHVLKLCRLAFHSNKSSWKAYTFIKFPTNPEGKLYSHHYLQKTLKGELAKTGLLKSLHCIMRDHFYLYQINLQSGGAARQFYRQIGAVKRAKIEKPKKSKVIYILYYPGYPFFFSQHPKLTKVIEKPLLRTFGHSEQIKREALEGTDHSSLLTLLQRKYDMKMTPLLAIDGLVEDSEENKEIVDIIDQTTEITRKAERLQYIQCYFGGKQPKLEKVTYNIHTDFFGDYNADNNSEEFKFLATVAMNGSNILHGIKECLAHDVMSDPLPGHIETLPYQGKSMMNVYTRE